MNWIEQDVLIENGDDPGREDPLVSAVQAGAPEAFTQLYALYSPRLYRTINAITKNPDDAQDALQETFLRAHLRIHSFQGRSSIYSWLTRIAINCALMTLRKRRTRPEVLFDPHPDHRYETFFLEVKDSAPNPEESYDFYQRQRKILRAIRRLDPKLQTALRMQMKCEWSVKEMSRALNISEAAVKSRLYRARQQLYARTTGHKHVAIHRLESLSASVARDTLLSVSGKASIENQIND